MKAKEYFCSSAAGGCGCVESFAGPGHNFCGHCGTPIAKGVIWEFSCSACGRSEKKPQRLGKPNHCVFCGAKL